MRTSTMARAKRRASSSWSREDTITLQFANAKHESYRKKFAKQITVTVKDA